MKKFKLIFLLVSTMFLLNGCWDATDVNSLAIVSSIGVDIQDDQYVVTLSLLTPSEFTETGGGNTPFNLYTYKGDTISEALQEVYTEQSRKLFIEHIQMIYISERVAKNGDLPYIIDLSLRGAFTRLNSHLIIVKGFTPEELMSQIVPTDLTTSFSHENLVENIASTYGIPANVTVKSIYNKIINLGEDVYIPVVEINGNIEDGQSTDTLKKTIRDAPLKVSKIGVFSDNIYVGDLTDEESVSLGLITNNTQKAFFTTDIRGCKYGVYINSYKVKNKVSYQEDKPLFNIDVNINAILEDITCQVLLDETHITEIENSFSKTIKSQIEDVFKKSQELRSDLFSFGEKLRRSDNIKWNEIKDNWKDEYKKANLEVSSSFTIKNSLTIKDFIKKNPVEE